MVGAIQQDILSVNYIVSCILLNLYLHYVPSAFFIAGNVFQVPCDLKTNDLLVCPLLFWGSNILLYYG